MSFNTFWTLWYHSLNEKRWDLASYQKLIVIKSPEDFWKVFNTINIKTGMLFLMRENTPPIWESPENIHGGAWSFMVNSDKNIENVFHNIASGILGESLISNENYMKLITGLTVTPKSDSFIVKIWTSKFHEQITFNQSYLVDNVNNNMLFKHHKKNLGMYKKNNR